MVAPVLTEFGVGIIQKVKMKVQKNADYTDFISYGPYDTPLIWSI